MDEEAIVRQPRQPDPNGARLVLLVPRPHVKEVKSALERHTIFDRHHGISPVHSEEQRMRVPTTIRSLEEGPNEIEETEAGKLLTELDLTHLSQHITLTSWTPIATINPIATENNPLRRALREALQALPPDTLTPLNIAVDLLVSTFPDSYSVYRPLLLLPSASLSPTWSRILTTQHSLFLPVWTHIASALHCTHMALNAPIPASNTPSSAHASDKENILRSPVNLVPILGSFGPSPTPQTLSCPTERDFDDALWVQTTQNGIRQTWAPLYTMFSRGNVKEKARILHLPSVASLTSTASISTAGSTSGQAAKAQGASAVDLYSGIGYFSFSYKRAGITRVLCFEMNPWSIQGLRRGCALNGWTCRVFTPAHVPAQDAAETEWDAWRDGAAGVGSTARAVGRGEDFWIFAMSNERADAILTCLREVVPPIRHVNLGLLPLSRPTWPSAVRAMDAKRGGWVHAHENVGLVDMDERSVEVEMEFQRLADACGHVGRQRREVSLEHVERVKMYAPGVVHAVFDVYIPGAQADD